MAQWIKAPDDTWVQFPDDTPAADIEKAMQQAFPPTDAAPAAVPDIPVQPVPTAPAAPDPDAWMKDPRVQAEAASAVEAVSPAPVPAGTTGEKRGSLLPISRSFTVDDQGQKQFSGDWNWAVPGAIADLPQQIESMATHRPGTEYTDEDIGGILNVASLEALPGLAKSAYGGVRSVLSGLTKKVPSNYIMDEMMNSVKTRLATEKTAKAQIVREEALKIRDKYSKYMRQPDIDQITKVVQRGAGPVRKGIEGIASKQGLSFGFDPGNIAATSLASTISPGTAGAYAASRIAGGTLSKGGILVAKGISKKLLGKDVKDIGKAVDLGNRPKIRKAGASPVEATRRAFQDNPGTATRTGRAPTPEEIAATTPGPYVPPTQPSSILSPTNPSGKIKMTIGDKPVKGTGTDPRFVAAQQEARRNAPSGTTERLKPAAQPTPRPPESTTSPLPKKENPAMGMIRDWLKVNKPTKPLPVVKPPEPGAAGVKKNPPPTTEAQQSTKRYDRLRRELDLARGDKMRADYAESNIKRTAEIEDADRRIKYLEEEIHPYENKGKQHPRRIISDAEAKTIRDIPEDNRTLQQKLDSANKAYDDTKYDEGDFQHTQRKRISAEIADLQRQIEEAASPAEKAAKAASIKAKAAEAEARKNAISPQGILAKQAAEIAAEKAAKVAAKVAEAKASPKPTTTTPKTGRVKVARKSERIVKAAEKTKAEAKLRKRMEVEPSTTDEEAVAGIKAYVKKRHDKGSGPPKSSVAGRNATALRNFKAGKKR